MNLQSGLPQDFDASSYDALIVGAGFAGAVCARRFAEACGWRVAVIERRDHIAGNAYDCKDDAGILIHKYGPHIYHTNSERVDSFLSRFTEWTAYQHKVLANVHGKFMPVPFNHASLKVAFGDERGEELYQKLVATFGKDKKVPIMELRKRGDEDLHEVADYIYENVFLHYTMKQVKRLTKLIRLLWDACQYLLVMMIATFLWRHIKVCLLKAIRLCLRACSITT